MGRVLFQVFLVVLFIFWVQAVEPPLWPQRFSQSMMVDFDDLLTPAKFWYDSKINSQKFEFQNGNTRKGCGLFYPGNTPCSYLINEGWLHLIYPERNLCCKLCQQQLQPRNWLENYTYLGEKQIDQQTFDVWHEFEGGDLESFYYADKSELRIPKRLVEGSKTFLDYWVNTYSQKPIPSTVFQVPSNCDKFCWQHLQNTTQIQQVIKTARKLMARNRLRRPLQTLKQ